MSEARSSDETASHDSAGSDVRLDQTPSPELRNLQLVELSILREFVRLCNAHGLRYFLAYGTLLGAVRHQGFIPWDDDIDVTMPRDDYDRFAEVCVSELRGGFRWQSYATEGGYPHWHGKLVKANTVLREAWSEHLQFEQSVYIDVFPLDGIADRRWEALAQHVLVSILRLRLGADLKRTPAKRLLVRLAKVLPRHTAIQLAEAMGRRYPTGTSRKWICVGGPYGRRRQAFPGRWFGAGANLTFENLTLVAPAEWDSYLSQLYGDYLTLPPTLDRVGTHGVTELQLEHEEPGAR